MLGGLLGHLARAITIARELVRRNCIVECVGHKRAEEFWIAAGLKGGCPILSVGIGLTTKVIPPRSALSWEQSCFCKVYAISREVLEQSRSPTSSLECRVSLQRDWRGSVEFRIHP